MPTYKAQRRLQMTRSMIHCPHVTTPWPLSLALQSFLCTYTRAIFQTEPTDPAILDSVLRRKKNKCSCKLQPEEATYKRQERRGNRAHMLAPPTVERLHSHVSYLPPSTVSYRFISEYLQILLPSPTTEHAYRTVHTSLTEPREHFLVPAHLTAL